MALAIQAVDDTPTLDELKLRLNKTLTVDDVELQQMLDAAVAEYEQLLGPIGTRTLRYDGGRESIILPLHSTVTAVAYDDGTVIDPDDLYVDDSSILRWDYNTTGTFSYGSRNVLVTFSVALPANHREAILADVAGYFAATQRGSSVGALPTGYETTFVENRSTPLVLFPRIRAVASSYPAIA